MSEQDLDAMQADEQEQYDTISRPLDEWEKPSDEVVDVLKELGGGNN